LTKVDNAKPLILGKGPKGGRRGSAMAPFGRAIVISCICSPLWPLISNHTAAIYRSSNQHGSICGKLLVGKGQPM